MIYLNDFNKIKYENKYYCDVCEYSTFDKRYMGLHLQYNHPTKLEEFLRVYDDPLTFYDLVNPEKKEIDFKTKWNDKK